MEYIIPAVSANVADIIEALAARDRNRAKQQAETLKRHELAGHYFTEITEYCELL